MKWCPLYLYYLEVTVLLEFMAWCLSTVFEKPHLHDKLLKTKDKELKADREEKTYCPQNSDFGLLNRIYRNQGTVEWQFQGAERNITVNIESLMQNSM